MLGNLRSFGPVKQPIPITGDVRFSSVFFDPVGTFRAELVYPTMTAYLELTISRGMTVWQVDEIESDLESSTDAHAFANTAVAPSPTPSPTPVEAAAKGKG